MEVSVVAIALRQPRKRLRDASHRFVVSEEGPEAPCLREKDRCQLYTEDVNGFPIPEEVSEGNVSHDYVRLNEAQETLIHGVMRSLGEELEVPEMMTFNCLSEEQEFDSFHLGDGTRHSEDCLIHRGIEMSIISAERLQSFEFHFDSFCNGKQRCKSSDHEALSVSASANVLEANDGAEKTGDIPSDDCRLFDIEYLLDASNGELGIAPSPSSETDFLFESFQGACTNCSKINETADFQQFWDVSSESLFELAQDDDYSNREIFRTISSFEMIPDPSATENSL